MRSLFSLLTAPASHGFCLLSSFSHIFTLSHPPPSHPSASLRLNLEPPPARSPSSRSVFFLSCYMSQIPVMFLPSDHWPTSLFFFFLVALFLASCFTRRLSFSRATSAFPWSLFYQKKCNLHIRPHSQNWASCCFTACPSLEVLYNYLACDVSTRGGFLRFLCVFMSLMFIKVDVTQSSFGLKSYFQCFIPVCPRWLNPEVNWKKKKNPKIVGLDLGSRLRCSRLPRQYDAVFLATSLLSQSPSATKQTDCHLH